MEEGNLSMIEIKCVSSAQQRAIFKIKAHACSLSKNQAHLEQGSEVRRATERRSSHWHVLFNHC